MAMQIRDGAFERPLRRSLHQRVIAGVCGGLAEWLGWNVTLVRLGFVGLALVSSIVPVVLLYLILALVLPEDRSRRAYLRWWESTQHY